jgi:hypothetical protein
MVNNNMMMDKKNMFVEFGPGLDGGFTLPRRLGRRGRDG